MTLWFVFALMTAAAIFAVLWPLSRRGSKHGGSDIAVYRDQLDEITRDRSAGLIGQAEAEAAKVEVSRRLIAAADAAEAQKPAPETQSLWRRRATAFFGFVVLPIGAVLLYLMLGSPQMPGEPLSARMQAKDESRAVERLIVQVEDHVARNPEDGRGWEVLAPVYMRLGRFDDAVRAWRNVLRLNGSNASREADLGEALVFAANGVVTVEAKAQFERALALDGQDVMARFYLATAADQDGRRAEAEAVWRDLLAKAPPGAPYVELLRSALERRAPTAPNVPKAPVAPVAAGAANPGAAAAVKAPADHDDAAIASMVARLAERMKTDGSNVDGWVQLVRSYRVLGQSDKAEAAIADARRALAADADKLRQFTAGIEAAAPAMPAAPPAPVAAAPAAGAAKPGAAVVKALADHDDAAIASMVARLAERMKTDGSNVEGWVQLVRSYRVLGQSDKVEAAIADARRALAGDADKLRQLAAGLETAAPAMPAAPPAPVAAAPAPAAGLPGPSAADIAAAQKLEPGQQNQMIVGMVARLADRLKQDGSDVEGWLRLVRAYMVLGERDKAQAAAADGRRALAGDADKIRRIDELVKELGVKG